MKKIAFILILILSVGAQAHALMISPSTEPQWSGDENDQSSINTEIAGIIGTAIELYKSEVPKADTIDTPTESGFLSGSYETTFYNSPTDPKDADIEYISGDIVSAPAYLLVKDGDHLPGWYLFDLTDLGWDGIDTLQLRDFWPDQGAISHVSLYGTAAPVPEPATMLLLGTGLIGLAGAARKKIKK